MCPGDAVRESRGPRALVAVLALVAGWLALQNVVLMVLVLCAKPGLAAAAAGALVRLACAGVAPVGMLVGGLVVVSGIAILMLARRGGAQGRPRRGGASWTNA